MADVEDERINDALQGLVGQGGSSQTSHIRVVIIVVIVAAVAVALWFIVFRKKGGGSRKPADRQRGDYDADGVPCFWSTFINTPITRLVKSNTSVEVYMGLPDFQWGTLRVFQFTKDGLKLPYASDRSSPLPATSRLTLTVCPDSMVHLSCKIDGEMYYLARSGDTGDTLIKTDQGGCGATKTSLRAVNDCQYGDDGPVNVWGYGIVFTQMDGVILSYCCDDVRWYDPKHPPPDDDVCLHVPGRNATYVNAAAWLISAKAIDGSCVQKAPAKLENPVPPVHFPSLTEFVEVSGGKSFELPPALPCGHLPALPAPGTELRMYLQLDTRGHNDTDTFLAISDDKKHLKLVNSVSEATVFCATLSLPHIGLQIGRKTPYDCYGGVWTICEDGTHNYLHALPNTYEPSPCWTQLPLGSSSARAVRYHPATIGNPYMASLDVRYCLGFNFCSPLAGNQTSIANQGQVSVQCAESLGTGFTLCSITCLHTDDTVCAFQNTIPEWQNVVTFVLSKTTTSDDVVLAGVNESSTQPLRFGWRLLSAKADDAWPSFDPTFCVQ